MDRVAEGDVSRLQMEGKEGTEKALLTFQIQRWKGNTVILTFTGARTWDLLAFEFVIIDASRIPAVGYSSHQSCVDWC